MKGVEGECRSVNSIQENNEIGLFNCTYICIEIKPYFANNIKDTCSLLRAHIEMESYTL